MARSTSKEIKMVLVIYALVVVAVLLILALVGRHV